MKVLLTHTPQARAQYYGERSLSGLQAIAEVQLHEGDSALDASGLIAAAQDVDIIVADRLTADRARFFRGCRSCAPSSAARSISATSMSSGFPAGVLVTQAGPGSSSRSPNSRSDSWSICRAASRAPAPTIMPAGSPK